MFCFQINVVSLFNDGVFKQILNIRWDQGNLIQSILQIPSQVQTFQLILVFKLQSDSVHYSNWLNCFLSKETQQIASVQRLAAFTPPEFHVATLERWKLHFTRKKPPAKPEPGSVMRRREHRDHEHPAEDGVLKNTCS
ncbi:hypothetical protein GOODEAATRI_032452 [Goodea atripinnis]|uniref:Uncharacterized protein n=1 Tax=Goodea atripinnis TaxID=208336 RepID=A0ABV0Q3M2_9TELE